jgi:hypothetical protein
MCITTAPVTLGLSVIGGVWQRAQFDMNTFSPSEEAETGLVWWDDLSAAGAAWAVAKRAAAEQTKDAPRASINRKRG